MSVRHFSVDRATADSTLVSYALLAHPRDVFHVDSETTKMRVFAALHRHKPQVFARVVVVVSSPKEALV